MIKKENKDVCCCSELLIINNLYYYSLNHYNFDYATGSIQNNRKHVLSLLYKASIFSSVLSHLVSLFKKKKENFYIKLATTINL